MIDRSETPNLTESMKLILFLQKIVLAIIVAFGFSSCATAVNNNYSGGGSGSQCSGCGSHQSGGCTGACGMGRQGCGRNCRPGHCVCSTLTPAPIVRERVVYVEKPVFIRQQQQCVQQMPCQQQMMRQPCQQQPRFNCNNGQQRYNQPYGMQQPYYGPQQFNNGGQQGYRGGGYHDPNSGGTFGWR
jgi:hypothetical protein